MTFFSAQVQQIQRRMETSTRVISKSAVVPQKCSPITQTAAGQTELCLIWSKEALVRKLGTCKWKWAFCTTYVFKWHNSGSSDRSRINQAASNFNARTGGCVRWVPRSSESNYVAIINSASGCWSYVGRTFGRQELNLANGCTGSGTIEHEMLHALGMWHEQSRTDRWTETFADS